jgi:GntR family transcriptional regulator
MIPIRLNPSSGTPLYVQLVEHLKHSIEAGAIKAGEQLPSVRRMAEELLINPNTVVAAYRELESDGIVVSKHGSGVFVHDSVVAQTALINKAEPVMRAAVDRLEALDLGEAEIRRLMENELAVRRMAKQKRKKHA